MPRWLVTGAGGMLGRDVLAALAAAAETDVRGLTRVELDVTDADAVAQAVEGCDVVVNAAAYTAVDAAQEDEAGALAVNGHAVQHLADACARHGARLLHVSTDYVFAGDAREPYPEDASVGPRSAYGRTKLAGERAVLATLPDAGYVVRTAWLYGEHGPNFVRTMVNASAKRDTVEVVTDQRGQPTWSADVADRLVTLGRRALVDAAQPGVYHATNAGATTWFGLTQAVFAELGLDTDRVRPTTSAAFVRPAPRPSYSVLGHDRWAAAGLAPMRDWRAALTEAMPAVRRGAGAGG